MQVKSIRCATIQFVVVRAAFEFWPASRFSPASGRRPDIDWPEILKWILVVLAAGFIGQFGKRLADYLLERRRRRRRSRSGDEKPQTAADLPAAPAPPQLHAPEPEPPELTPPQSPTDAKTLKKLAKAEIKKAKKSM